jgi:hypothetical protein
MTQLLLSHDSCEGPNGLGFAIYGLADWKAKDHKAIHGGAP